MHVLAEGAETAEQMAFLRDAGCHKIHGYRFGPPVATAEFEPPD
jgi:EAL domain-containing protein (putative c-di-GMP-specific phosphodiesterase class I)